jgi:protein-S-isoprenylcysteine O-methyltransferase Ste14
MAQTDTSSQPDNAGVIAPPPLIFVGVLAIALAIDWLIAGPSLGMSYGLRMLMATILLIPGAALLFAAGAGFSAAKTNIPPWKPSTALVTSGIYRYTRNPMYLGMALAYAGLSVFADSLIALLGLPVALAVMHYGVIAREERYLEQKFGAEYRSYKSAARRWL